MTNEVLDLLIAFMAGVVMIIFGNYKRGERSKFLSNGIRTEGIVFRMERITDIKDTMYYPVVRFTTLEK